jgi:excisionase family DNA binding protein
VSHDVSQHHPDYQAGDEWMTIAQAISYAKISRATLYRLMDQGVLPFYRVSGTRQRRFKRSDLDKLMIREEPGQPDGTYEEED